MLGEKKTTLGYFPREIILPSSLECQLIFRTAQERHNMFRSNAKKQALTIPICLLADLATFTLSSDLVT